MGIHLFDEDRPPSVIFWTTKTRRTQSCTKYIRTSTLWAFVLLVP